MKKQNIIVALLIGALVGFLVYSVLDNSVDKNVDKSTNKITNDDRVEVTATETSEVDTEALEDISNTPESTEIVEESTETNVAEQLELSEEDKKIEEANPEDAEYIICVIRKNDLGDSTTYDIVSNTTAKNHYIGLMTLKLDASLVEDAEISEDNTVTENEEQTITEEQSVVEGIDVKNLELGKYYLVTTATEIEQGPIITINSIREAEEYEVKNFESGRVQNSTFTTDFEQLKLMEPKEALEKSLTLQYTWSFEQIEIFKAYIESKKAESEESKKAWEEAETEIDLDLGY